MRRFAGVAAIAALLLSATVVTAADLVGSPGGPAAPTSSTSARAATPTPTTTSATTTEWTAALAPVQVTGSVTVAEAKNGDGTVTFKLNDMLDESAWTVRLESGVLDGTHGLHLIAARSGDEVQHLQGDTIRILLTKAEMVRFTAARTSAGVVALISDGSRLSVAAFPAG